MSQHEGTQIRPKITYNYAVHQLKMFAISMVFEYVSNDCLQKKKHHGKTSLKWTAHSTLLCCFLLCNRWILCKI